jgi:pimeloyl-ACP methyl ester carboxylesterase
VTLTKGSKAWLEAGTLEVIGARRIFVREQLGEGPPVVLLHGYPSSSYDWRHVLGRLGGRHVLAFDFLGFGLSDKPQEHRYSLLGAADLTEQLAARFDGEPVVLVAHDMATSVVAELLARDLEGTLSLRLAAALMFNGGIVVEFATLSVGQKLLRTRFGSVASHLSTETAFRAQMGRIFSPAHPLPEQEAADQWSLITNGGGNRILDKLTLYLQERVRFAARWHGALRAWPGHLELAWGLQDPVCTRSVLDAVLELRPEAPVTMLPELGHYPQLEDPESVTEIIARLAEQQSAVPSGA